MFKINELWTKHETDCQNGQNTRENKLLFNEIKCDLLFCLYTIHFYFFPNIYYFLTVFLEKIALAHLENWSKRLQNCFCLFDNVLKEGRSSCYCDRKERLVCHYKIRYRVRLDERESFCFCLIVCDPRWPCCRFWYYEKTDRGSEREKKEKTVKIRKCSEKEKKRGESRCHHSGAPPPGEAQWERVPQHLPVQLAAASLPGEQGDRQRECYGGGRGQGVSPPCLSIPLSYPPLSLSLSLSLSINKLFAFERALPVKKKKKRPPHMKANVRGKGRLWQRLMKGKRTVLIFTDNTGFFFLFFFLYPAGFRVGNFWIRRMEQETVTLALVNLKSSCDTKKKEKKAPLIFFTHTDVMKEKSKLQQNQRSHLFSYVIIYLHNTRKERALNSHSIGPDSKTRICRWAAHFEQNRKLTLSAKLLI